MCCSLRRWAAVTELIDRERDGEGVDRSLLKKCIEVRATAAMPPRFDAAA
jgi:hypothetical protein